MNKTKKKKKSKIGMVIRKKQKKLEEQKLKSNNNKTPQLALSLLPNIFIGPAPGTVSFFNKWYLSIPNLAHIYRY